MGPKATCTNLAVVACAIALHGGESFYSDREAKRTFGVHVSTDVQLWVWRLRKLAAPSTPPATVADASTSSPAAYRRPPPMLGRKRGRPPITSYTPQELQELMQRKEAKRHHEATWRERDAAHEAARAEKAAAFLAAYAAREAARAEKAAACEAAQAAKNAAEASARWHDPIAWPCSTGARSASAASAASTASAASAALAASAVSPAQGEVRRVQHVDV